MIYLQTATRPKQATKTQVTDVVLIVYIYSSTLSACVAMAMVNIQEQFTNDIKNEKFRYVF